MSHGDAVIASDRLRAAIHEAGHALINVLGNLRLRSAWIECDDPGGYRGARQSEIPNESERDDSFETWRVVSLVAGKAAEVHAGLFDEVRPGHQADYAEAMTIARKVAGSIEGARVLIARSEATATMLVDQSWEAIETLARHMLAVRPRGPRGKMLVTGPNVNRIVRPLLVTKPRENASGG